MYLKHNYCDDYMRHLWVSLTTKISSVIDLVFVYNEAHCYAVFKFVGEGDEAVKEMRKEAKKYNLDKK
jgi:hypothetical protein